jgi:hypothetical protein
LKALPSCKPAYETYCLNTIFSRQVRRNLTQVESIQMMVEK